MTVQYVYRICVQYGTVLVTRPYCTVCHSTVSTTYPWWDTSNKQQYCSQSLQWECVLFATVQYTT